MNLKKIFYFKKETTISGFILVEVIVSIFILMLAVPAALTIASKSVFLASYSKDQIIATYLAQEGIEIVRNRRDQNMLQGGLWLLGIGSGKYRVDYGVGVSDPLVESCSSAVCSLLYKNTANGTYSHTSGAGEATHFSRYVETQELSSGHDLLVTSVVSYSTHGIIKTVTLTENLTPWI